jgi:hypothetical protein
MVFKSTFQDQLRLFRSWTPEPLEITALDGDGNVVDQTTVPGDNSVHTIELTGPGIASVVITGGGSEGVLVEICVDTKPEPGLLDCVDFEDLPLGTVYNVKDTFTDSGVTITVLPFQRSDGSWTDDGFAEVVAEKMAGGSGQEIRANEVNLGFDIGGPLEGLSVLFGEYGGNLNININGDFRNFENFADINGATIGGVYVSVVNGHGNDSGSLKLTGTMKKFAIEEGEFIFVIGGGPELWIDNVCTGPEPEPPPCVDFEDPPLGMVYNVNDAFTDSGVTIAVLPFQWGDDSWTHDGFAEVGDQKLAGGSGQEINTNNVNLGFDISGPLEGLSVLFGEYGGNLNININGDFWNFKNFDDINGATIGGVHVSVVNGHGNDSGSLKLTGTMEKFAFEEGEFEGEFIFVIGGQELWIDDVCTVPVKHAFGLTIVTP